MIALGLTVLTPASGLILGISASVEDGNGAIGFQEFIPAANPRAKFNLDTARFFEQIFAPLTTVDVELTVTRELADTGSALISVDKFTFNNTGVGWLAFGLTLGTGFGGAFIEAEGSGLFFMTTPAPINEGAIFTPLPSFSNPPALDEAVEPENLLWSGGFLASGLDTSYWLGVEVPEALFVAAGPNEVARFTVRQNATAVPEPSTVLLSLCGLGLLALGSSRRRKRADS